MKNLIPTASIESINPALAKEWLDKSPGNRTTKLLGLNKLVTAMADGRFKITNGGVAFDFEGNLIDGHTRLKAVIKANVTVQMFVFRNLDKEVRLLIDTGDARTFKNSLEMLGLCIFTDDKGKKHNLSRQVSQLATYLMLFQQKSNSICNGKGNITNDLISEFVTRNEAELVNTTIMIENHLKVQKYMVKNHFAFLYQIYKFIDEAKILEFINIVGGTQISNKENCPATLLKNKLINNHSGKGGKVRTSENYGFVVDACNKFMNDQPTKKLTFKETLTEKGEVKLKLVGELSETGKEFLNLI